MLIEALMCLALNIYHEARGQGTDGMKAVAHVTMNRANWKADRVCDVVFKPYQFSWANRLTTVDSKTRIKRAKGYMPKDKKSWDIAKSIAQKALDGNLPKEIKDTLGNSKFYVNPEKATASWYKKMTLVATIGDHQFYTP